MSESPKPLATPEQIAKADQFGRLYCAWLRARAEHTNPDRDDKSDKLGAAASEAVSESARQLLAFPSTLDWMVWCKWEVLDLLVHGDGEFADWADNRVVVALASIKADIMRLGIGGSR